MSSCPHCQQKVASDAIKCPHCGTILKAYGHVGIPLHQATVGAFLCDDCLYHRDDTCDFPQRPHAKTCTLYQSYQRVFSEDTQPFIYRQSPLNQLKSWTYQHRGILLLVVLGMVSLIMALSIL